MRDAICAHNSQTLHLPSKAMTFKYVYMHPSRRCALQLVCTFAGMTW